MSARLRLQAEYVVWRDSVVRQGGDRKSKSKSQNEDFDLIDGDPGARAAHRWRKRFCMHRIGQESAKLPKAKGAKPYTVPHRGTVTVPTLGDLHSSKPVGSRLRKLGALSRETTIAAEAA
jgi:hypothetical protein